MNDRADIDALHKEFAELSRKRRCAILLACTHALAFGFGNWMFLILGLLAAFAIHAMELSVVRRIGFLAAKQARHSRVRTIELLAEHEREEVSG